MWFNGKPKYNFWRGYLLGVVLDNNCTKKAPHPNKNHKTTRSSFGLRSQPRGQEHEQAEESKKPRQPRAVKAGPGDVSSSRGFHGLDGRPSQLSSGFRQFFSTCCWGRIYLETQPTKKGCPFFPMARGHLNLSRTFR